MFQSLPLIEAFQYLASPDEWSWFGPMVRRRALHFGVDGWPLFEFKQLRDYQALWPRLAAEALEKLRDGEWVAEGICLQFGPQRVPIERRLWDYMHIVDRLEEAEGGGFHFLALSASQVGPPKVEVSHAKKGHLRKQLTEWIRLGANLPGPPLLREEQLAAARAAFAGCHITANMFRDCRRLVCGERRPARASETERVGFLK